MGKRRGGPRAVHILSSTPGFALLSACVEERRRRHLFDKSAGIRVCCFAPFVAGITLLVARHTRVGEGFQGKSNLFLRHGTAAVCDCALCQRMPVGRSVCIAVVARRGNTLRKGTIRF